MRAGRVLVLGGAGDIGSAIVEELVKLGAEVDIGDLNVQRALGVARSLKHFGDVGVVKVDVTSKEDMAAARRYDVVVNAVGPFYRHGHVVASALIELGIDAVDVCDDHDAAERILELHRRAVEKEVTFVTGLGWTPGLSNILAKKCCEELGGEVDEVSISWFGSAADSKGLAVVMHLFHAVTGEVPMYLEGRLTKVKAGTSPAVFEFPGVGKLKLYYVGHPEPLTISKHLKVSRNVTVRGGLVPAWQNGLLRALVGMGLTSTEERLERLSRAVHRVEGVFRVGGPALSGVRVEAVRGERRVSYCSVNRMRKLTAAPAALGARLILKGEVSERGVLPPEAVIDPLSFLEGLRGLGVGVEGQ
ncbi:MAG: saccharopine dehydrogenase C-terminal domain-containing protein [Candidatus Caldarchaeales archaeon]